MGYGKTTVDKKSYWAHRLSYLAFYGEIAKDKLVMHKCDNPSCVNPEHLQLGYYRDNNRDAIAKGRNTRGTKSHLAKINERDVVAIRALYFTGRFTQKEIGLLFKLKQGTIHKIVYNKKWRHVK